MEHDCPMSKTCTLAHLFLQHLNYSLLPPCTQTEGMVQLAKGLATAGSWQQAGNSNQGWPVGDAGAPDVTPLHQQAAARSALQAVSDT